MKLYLKMFMASLLLLATPVAGQESEQPPSSLEGLAGVAVMAEPLSQDLVERGLTTEWVETFVGLRLREAGVKVFDPGSNSAPGSPTLYISLSAILTPGVENCTYVIRIDLLQTARLERDPDFPPLQVPTWGVSWVAFHGSGWRQAIMDDILAYTDEFIAEFSAANPHATR